MLLYDLPCEGIEVICIGFANEFNISLVYMRNLRSPISNTITTEKINIFLIGH